MFQLLNLALLSLDLWQAYWAGLLNRTSLTASSAKWLLHANSDEEEEQHLGLRLPSVGAVIDLAEQEGLVAEWQAQVEEQEGEEGSKLQGAANTAGSGLALWAEAKLCGSKIILGEAYWNTGWLT